MSLSHPATSLPGIPRPSLDHEPPPIHAEGRPTEDRDTSRRNRPPDIFIPQHPNDNEPVTPEEAVAIDLTGCRNSPEDEPGRRSQLEALAAVARTADPALRGVLFVGCGTLLLILGSQLASFAVALRALPLLVQVAGGAIASGLLVLVGFGLFVLIREFLRLRQSPRVALRQLAERAATREAGDSRIHDAARDMKTFLEDHVQNVSRASLLRLGMTDEEWQELEENRERLRRAASELETLTSESLQAWLDDIDHEFLTVLDRVADRRIFHAAKRTGLSAALTPTGLLDTALVAAASVTLVRDLCRLYNLRTDRWGTFVVLAHMAGNLVIAGRNETWAEDATEGVVDWLQGTVGSAAGGFFLKFAGARTAEGISHYLLLRRLGRVTRRALRPIVRE